MYLKKKLESGTFAVMAELAPPKGNDVTEMLGSAAKLMGKVDAILVPDMTGATMRMSALGAAALLQAKVTDTVLQVCCRDRNRLALQADLLAASAHGITNLVVAGAEDPAMGDHPQAKAVNDLQPLELMEAVQALTRGRYLAGRDLAGAPKFTTGATFQPDRTGKAFKAEIEDVRRMAAAGAAYFIAPPVFDLEVLRPFVELIEGEGIRIIPTVLLLKSVGMARYIAAHLGQIRLPGDLIDRIQDADDAPHECVRIASELVSRIREEGFSGVLLSAFGWEGRLLEVIGTLGPRDQKSCVGGAP